MAATEQTKNTGDLSPRIYDLVSCLYAILQITHSEQ